MKSGTTTIENPFGLTRGRFTGVPTGAWFYHGVILCRKIYVDGFARMQNAQTGEVFSNETVSMMVKRKQDHCIIVSVTITPDFVKGESSC